MLWLTDCVWFAEITTHIHLLEMDAHKKYLLLKLNKHTKKQMPPNLLK